MAASQAALWRRDSRAERLPRRAFLRAVGGGLLGAAGLLGGDCAAPPAVTDPNRPRRLVIATGAAGGVYYPYGSGIASLVSRYVRGVQATAEITSASVDNLKLLRDGKADLAFTQADTLYDAVKLQGPFAEGNRMPALTLAALYTDYAHVVTLADRGIERLTDLRGRAVALGPEGSGTEIAARRLLEAVGLRPATDLRALPLGVGPAVQALHAGQLDAVFWLGGLPSTAILDLATIPGTQLVLLPTAVALPALQARFGSDLYQPATIPRTAYPGLAADVPVLGVANLLVVHEQVAETLVYRIAEVLFERQPELAAIHLEARHLTPETAVVGSPAEFHAGAVKYYRERQAWRG